MNGQYDIQVALTNSCIYTVQWYPQTNQQYTDCKMTPSVFRGAAKDYMTVDLETGVVTYEANTMSAACANAIKYIVNRTGYMVVIAAIPQMWDKFLGGNRDEVLQLVNRCQPVIRAERIPEADAALFLRSHGVKGVAAFARRLAEAGTTFGGFRTVAGIARRLAEAGEPTEEDFAAELRVLAEQVAASGIGR